MIVEQRRLINPCDALRTKPVIVTFASSFILFREECDIGADVFNEAEIWWKTQPDILVYQFTGDIKQTCKNMDAPARG